MIEGLKPYAEYKDSDLPWIGKIPKHWDVKRFKYLLREINTRSLDGHEQLLRVSQYTGVTPRLSLNGDNEPDTRAESLVGYKQVTPGDLVVNIMLAWNGSLGVARSAGIVSPAYCVYRFNDHAEPWYYHNLLRIPLYKGRIKIDSTGVIESRLRLYSDKLFSIEAILPIQEEQATIARFVNAFGHRIDRLIRDKRRLIKLLNEKKQIIIHRAVTRGLDPKVHLKPSGVEWLGDVPAHWEVTKLKHVAKVQTGITLGKNYGSVALESRPYLRVANVQDGFLDLKEITTVSVPVSEASACELQPGDVLMTEGGDIDKLGRGYIWRGEIPHCIHQNHVFAVRCIHNKLMPEFLSLVMTSSHGRHYFQLTAKQTTNLASTNSTTLKTFPLVLPSVREQSCMLDQLRCEFAPVESAIERAEKEIDLIREYQTRLIADVVTGKLDVRGAELTAMDEAVAQEDIETGEDTETESEELIESEEATDADN